MLSVGIRKDKQAFPDFSRSFWTLSLSTDVTDEFAVIITAAGAPYIIDFLLYLGEDSEETCYLVDSWLSKIKNMIMICNYDFNIWYQIWTWTSLNEISWYHAVCSGKTKCFLLSITSSNSTVQAITAALLWLSLGCLSFNSCSIKKQLLNHKAALAFLFQRQEAQLHSRLQLPSTISN